jgi:dienelactone hydrolase
MPHRYLLTALVAGLALTVAGCGISIFPVWPPLFFDEPPAEVGPFAVREYRVDVPEGADGQPAGITVFAPTGATDPLPALVWVLGSNVQAYYHQSLHETLASWGYAVIVSDGRPLVLDDFQYHRRTVDLAKQAVDLAVAGELAVTIDAARIAAGGYSIGGTMATFLAAEDSRIQSVVLWAPTSAPFWLGVDPVVLFPQVNQPVFFLLAELDNVAPPEEFPQEMQDQMPQADISEFIIPQGLHLFFQQPDAADSVADPATTLTRFEQQGIAIERTRAYLDEQLAGDAADAE